MASRGTVTATGWALRASGNRLVAPPPVLSGEGQWAFGHREPLNPEERIKKEDDPHNVRARIEHVYASQELARIDPDDLRCRFRWWGLYPRRWPRTDGEPPGEGLTMRIRVDGGQLNLAQLKTVAEICDRYALGAADLTNRQNIRLHRVRIQDVPLIWRALAVVGLSTMDADGDCPQAIMGSPVAGVSADEVLDATPAIHRAIAHYRRDGDLCNLPYPYQTAISWLPDVPYATSDVAFLGVVHPDHGPGFDLWAGGRPSASPTQAQRLGAWVPIDEVPQVWAAAAALFRDYGYRRLRQRSRLNVLVADWGIDRFRDVLEAQYLGYCLADGPAPTLPASPIDHIGVHRQCDGRYYVGACPLRGRLSGGQLTALAETMVEHGIARIRLTPYRKLLVLDVDESSVDNIRAALYHLGMAAGEAMSLLTEPPVTSAWSGTVKSMV